MTIVDELKVIIEKKGHSASGIKTIADAVKKLAAIEEDVNPLKALALSVEIDPNYDLLGKKVGDLQENVVIGYKKITGTLKYVTNYDGFSSKASEKKGNFIALYCPLAKEEGVNAVLINEIGKQYPIDSSDGIIIYRMTGSALQTLTIQASKEGYDTVTKVYDISDLILEAQ